MRLFFANYHINIQSWYLHSATVVIVNSIEEKLTELFCGIAGWAALIMLP